MNGEFVTITGGTRTANLATARGSRSARVGDDDVTGPDGWRDCHLADFEM
jgi:hypothetical protein